MFKTLFLLLIGHAFGDFAFQSDWMSKNKNRNRKPDYIPEGQKYTPTWFYVLGAHALIHGGIVYFITGNLSFGVLESIVHGIADFMKCENWTNPHIDQALHLSMKVLYALQMQRL